MKALLHESIAWLREHPQPLTSEIPPHLIDAWLYSAAEPHELPRPCGFYLAVFGYGYLQSRLLAPDRPPLEPFEIKTADLLFQFCRFQARLGSIRAARWPYCAVPPSAERLLLFPEDVK